MNIASGRSENRRIRERRSVLLLVFLVLVFSELRGQTTITGRVRDAKTLEPMHFASVYLNLTTIGVYANEQGGFILKNVPAGAYELIVSHVGYQTYQTRVNVRGDSTQLELDIKLVSQTLSGVTITSARDGRWKSQLARFHTLFFGNTELSKDCKILNPWVLSFKEDAANGFTAVASAPLKIENLGLGYSLSYQLKKFQVSSTHYAISGVSWFQQMATLDTALINLWERRKMEAYDGSFRHLLKAIQTRSLTDDGFELYEDISNSDDVIRKAAFVSNLDKSIVPVPAGTVVAEKHKDLYTIRMPTKTEVHYTRKKAIPKIYRNIAVPISWIEVKGGKLEMNGYGMVLNPTDVMVSGEMGEARISSLLPFDYVPRRMDPAKTSKKTTDLAVSESTSKLVLLERPYVQTDKSLYYADESIWFNAYMNYYSRVYSDTLSKVLYVDLVDVKRQIVSTKIFPIDSTGAARGSIPLQSLRAGDYQLRAYTRWMLNFDKALIYRKSIKVLAADEIPVPHAISIDSVSSLEVGTPPGSIRAGQKLTFSLQVKDDYGFLQSGSLSVAVVPAAFIIADNVEAGVMEKVAFGGDVLHFPTQLNHSIQQGIDISGQVEMPAKMKKRKKKNSQPVVIFKQVHSDDLLHVFPEKNGMFRLPALQFFDSARFSAQALILRDSKQLTWTIDSVNISPEPTDFRGLLVEVRKMSVRRVPVHNIDSTLSVSILDEVTVSDTRARDVRGSSIHIGADVVITGESLANAENGDFLSLLQSRVPGLRVLVFNDGGIPRKMLKLGGFTSMTGAIKTPESLEPLVMVDGRVLNGMGGTAADQLAAMVASSIERIEVIKFGGGAAYGARGANGVIAIYTNYLTSSAKKESSPIDESLYRPVNVQGYASQTKFSLPQFDPNIHSEGSTIYWNPSVLMDGKGPTHIFFELPNVSGEYVIVVGGVTSLGKQVKGSKKIFILRHQ